QLVSDSQNSDEQTGEEMISRSILREEAEAELVEVQVGSKSLRPLPHWRKSVQ
ncbi:Hypothetical protein SMAX5B_010674, partial [Scophthalmus maximus]